VILWNIDKDGPIKIFEVKDAPTCISFHPELENIFVTGSLDQSIRRWSIDQPDDCLEVIHTANDITALAYQPNGKRLIVGYKSTGNFSVYQSDDIGRLNWSTKLDCKNQRGKFALGRKVSGICFLNQKEVIITTNDSRLRLFNLDETIQKVKFKGFKGENLQLKSSINN